MNKRVERQDAGGGGPQSGAIGAGSVRRQSQDGADRDADEWRGDIGVGGQRDRGGSSRDPDAQGRRTEEEARG